MTMSLSILLTALFTGEPARVSAPTVAKSRVYLVYVTVVEVDADGNETVLFTPRVQTTGKPAGVTVDHADGRSFEFHCQLATAAAPALERPPAAAATAKIDVNQPVSAAGLFPTSVSIAKSLANSSPPADPIPETYSVRTYDVSDLLDPAENPKAADFEPLIQTLKVMAMPESWSDKATIRPFASTKSLVVKQHEAGHRAVAATLKELRPSTEEKSGQTDRK